MDAVILQPLIVSPFEKEETGDASKVIDVGLVYCLIQSREGTPLAGMCKRGSPATNGSEDEETTAESLVTLAIVALYVSTVALKVATVDPLSFSRVATALAADSSTTIDAEPV
jgi:hypothetical protein